MSSPKSPQKQGKLEFSGRLPRFLAGPPIAFTDTANDNFMRFYFNLLSSSSHNAELFKKTLGHIMKYVDETSLCYCEVKTTPIAEQCYKDNILKARMREYAEELELNRKELALYITKNIGCMVLLSLLSRALMNSQVVSAANYTHAIDDQVAFKFLGSKFGYRLEQVDSLYQFTGKVVDFDIQIGFQLLGGNHSDVVEVLKFRSESPTANPKFGEQDQQTESVFMDSHFEPPQQAKKASKWEKVRQAFLVKSKHQTPTKQSTDIKAEQSTGVKEDHEECSKLPDKKYDYLHAHERPLNREHDYDRRYRL